MTKEEERLDKLNKAFNKRLNEIKNLFQLLRSELDEFAKTTPTDVIMKVRAVLTKDIEGWYSVGDKKTYYPEDKIIKKDDGKFCAPDGSEVEWLKERILRPDFDFVGYIFKSIGYKKQDVKKHTQTKLKAFILDPGDPITNYSEIKKGKEYSLGDIKELKKLQSLRGKETVAYVVRNMHAIPLSQGISKNEDKNDANYFIGQWSIREFDEEEKKKNIKEALSERLNQLGTKCKNLLKEYRSRNNKEIEPWATEKGMKYSKLKSMYHRCVKKAKELGFKIQVQGA